MSGAGVRLALDWGASRVGVAACDAQGTLAYPVKTVTGAQDEAHLAREVDELVAEYAPTAIVLGLPLHLGGAEGQNARAVRFYAAQLARRYPELEVRLVDERLSTTSAQRDLREAGRRTRQQRAVIDQAAAVAILNTALDSERLTGRPAGELIKEADN